MPRPRLPFQTKGSPFESVVGLARKLRCHPGPYFQKGENFHTYVRHIIAGLRTAPPEFVQAVADVIRETMAGSDLAEIERVVQGVEEELLVIGSRVKNRGKGPKGRRPFRTPGTPWRNIKELAENLVTDQGGPLFGKPLGSVQNQLATVLRGERPPTETMLAALQVSIERRLVSKGTISVAQVIQGMLAELRACRSRRGRLVPDYAAFAECLVNAGPMHEPLVAVFETLGQYNARTVAEFLETTAELGVTLSKETCLGLLKDMAGRKEEPA